jgi:hypothetical protein
MIPLSDCFVQLFTPQSSLDISFIILYTRLVKGIDTG